MSRSRLQKPFLREVAAIFLATKARLARRLTSVPSGEGDAIIEEELKGLYHGLFVILDGGSGLANQGLVRLVDEDGMIDRFLHEICFEYWPGAVRTTEQDDAAS
jgi:hypothetical protein